MGDQRHCYTTAHMVRSLQMIRMSVGDLQGSSLSSGRMTLDTAILGFTDKTSVCGVGVGRGKNHLHALGSALLVCPVEDAYLN